MRGRIVFWLLCAALARPALADSPTPEEQERAKAEAQFATMLWSVEAPKARTRACFARAYDAAHLKAHPHQKVVEIHVSVHYKPEARAATTDSAGQSHWGYAIETRLRDGQHKTFRDDGTCGGFPTSNPDASAPRFLIRCDAACDAGDDLFVDNDGKKARLKHADLVHPEYNEPGADEKLAAKADDGVFLLYRAADADCAFDGK